MALLDRLKERFESDVSDAELQLVIDEANLEVIARCGPDSDPAIPLVIMAPGGDSIIALGRPASAVTSIVETVGTTPTTLAVSDWRLWYGGRILERVSGGANSRSAWGDRITISYTPVNDGNQRQEVILKLAILDLTYRGLIKTERVGDYESSGSLTAVYQKERDIILNSLTGMVFA